jgi:hypothetical protein
MKRAEAILEWSKFAIPSYNDQLTNDRIRGCQLLRRGDDNPWLCRVVFQLGIGLFHLQMNLAWCILNKHRFKLEQIGSLAFYFEILEKKHLGAEKPDYYTLIAALSEIRDALLLNTWHKKLSAKGMTAVSYANSRPSVENLLSLAHKILNDYASPMNIPLSTDLTSPNPNKDPIHQNSRYLLRDLLYFTELSVAISSGDFGRVEVILPDIAALFCAAGSYKYTSEILHLLYNFKKVWTPGFA